MNQVFVRVVLLLFLSGCGGHLPFFPELHSDDITKPVEVTAPTDGRTFLDQGWTSAERTDFYTMAQGSRVLPLLWYLALEQEDSTEKFSAPAYIRRFRYIPAQFEDIPVPLPLGWVVDKKVGDSVDCAQMRLLFDIEDSSRCTANVADFVGEAKSRDASDLDSKLYIGPTCAACHTTDIIYDKKTLRIDGAPTLADMNGFKYGLDAALAATLANPQKFERFAKEVERVAKLLGQPPGTLQRDELRDEVQKRAFSLKYRNHLVETDVEYGFGRVDAIGFIFNQVMANFNGIPSNGLPGTAPTSYPFLWGTHQADKVQWDGFAGNQVGGSAGAGIGMLLRNAGEVLGVYGTLELKGKGIKYESSVRIEELGWLEKSLRTLRSPAWPKDFPNVDMSKAKQGEELYATYCLDCHKIVYRDDEGKLASKDFDSANVQITPLDTIGTDPNWLYNAYSYRDAGKFLSKKTIPLVGPTIPARTSALNALVNASLGLLLDDIRATRKALKALNGKPGKAPPRVPGPEKGLVGMSPAGAVKAIAKSALEKAFKKGFKKLVGDDKLYSAPFDPSEHGYKARPLNGIWATAPFLHNGSVPTLWALMQPPAQRPSTFVLGTREFDPVCVGFVEQVAPEKVPPAAPGSSAVSSEQSKASPEKPGTAEKLVEITDPTKQNDAPNDAAALYAKCVRKVPVDRLEYKQFLFDTRLPGNSNAGHVYGTSLTEDQRWALVEYMKTLGTESNPTYGLETIPADESKAIKSVADLSAKFLKKKHSNGKGPAQRDAHSKAHGCVKAEFEVGELPKELQVGIFKEPRSYSAWIRYSNGNPTPQPDKIGDGRGMAIKLMGVDGKKLLADEEEAETQDFLMINNPVFFVDTASNYVKFTKAQQGGSVLRYFIGLRNPKSWRLKAARIARAITKAKVVNPLQSRYWSMAPYLLGRKAVKFSAKPCESKQGSYTQTASPNFLADNMEINLKENDACFEFMVQFQKSAKKMPVENPTVKWSEKASPFRTVARIRIPKQTFRSSEQMQFCEDLSYTPWHSLPEHRPLGGINRMRKVVYETISRLRHKINGVERQEPTAGQNFLTISP